ncbi:MAG: DUF2934 domain-containing protein [Bryobacteraceae bacterium]|nr:DUF2934 domain-containing protein [Bryobacteraceae bacterium]
MKASSTTNTLPPETAIGSEAGDQQRSRDPIGIHESIAALAYQLWEARGCPEGSPEQDWHRAQQMLAAGTRD